MAQIEALADRFEVERTRLRAIAYRMLGTLSEAEDAVQEAWLRLSGSRADEIENLPAWLTTVVTRICLNMLQSRRVRHEVGYRRGSPPARSVGHIGRMGSVMRSTAMRGRHG